MLRIAHRIVRLPSRTVINAPSLKITQSKNRKGDYAGYSEQAKGERFRGPSILADEGVLLSVPVWLDRNRLAIAPHKIEPNR